MRTIHTTPFDLATRFIGIKEVPGTAANQQILSMLNLDNKWPKDDSVPWCSAFINYIAWLLSLQRTKSLMARSWLECGMPVEPEKAAIGFDIVVLKRGSGNQPGPEVINAPGHVGFFAGYHGVYVNLLSGNTHDTVGFSSYQKQNILGIRRLISE